MAPSPPKKTKEQEKTEQDKKKAKSNKKAYEEEDELSEEDQALQVCHRCRLHSALACAFLLLGRTADPTRFTLPPCCRAGANGAPRYTRGACLSLQSKARPQPAAWRTGTG